MSIAGALSKRSSSAPLTRRSSLPAGTWYDFNTNKKYEGGNTYTIQPGLTDLPIFIKAGTILPLAKPLEHLPEGARFELTCYVYGDAPATVNLFEDDGYTFNYEKGSFNTVTLTWDGKKGKLTRKGNFKQKNYEVKSWQAIR